MAIPEFVLKKLVKPGSLKKEGTGFAFILNNTFAPATIQRFEIIVDGQSVPSVAVSFSSSKTESKTCDSITPESPMLTPVGVEITIRVQNQPLTNDVVVKAHTKEVGEIAFSLTPNAASKKTRGLKRTLMSHFTSPLEASIKVNLTNISEPASPFLLGQFIEHLERCIYDGIWTSDGSSLREDVLDLVQQLNPPLIRYPGGNFASGYHWEDGIGPKSRRPHRHDAAWQAEESNLVGTDEFLAYCELIGTEPLLVVNDGSGSAEEAARWVAYCNNPTSSEQGKRRAANGHPEPYKVKYWGIGNEVWGPWQIGTTSAEEYTRRLLRFSKAMKAVDPSITLVAVGNHPLTEDPNDPAARWNQEVLSKAGDQVDYLSWHIYQPEKEGWGELPEPFELFKSICAAPLDIDIYTRRVEKQIAHFSPNKKVLQALDEWNVWLPPLPAESSMHQVTYTMRDALYVASALATFFRLNQTMGMTNLAQMVNVLPLIKTNARTAIATTIFYPFILFNQMQPRVVTTTCISPVYDSQAIGPNIAAHQDVPWLDHLLTCDESREHLTLLLINRHPEKRMAVEFSLDANVSSLLELKAAHPLDANTFSHPHKVKLISGKKPTKADSLHKSVLEPASIVMIEFSRN